VERLLNEFESKKLLKKYGINVVDTYVANSESEAVEIGRKIGYPVVLKVLSHEVIHKTEHGGVILDIRNDKELIEAYRRISKISKTVTVQRMVDGFEFFVGVSSDQAFGKTIAFGSGGVLVSLLKDFTLRIIPIDRRDAEEMVEELKISKIFHGYRNFKANRESVIELLLKVSELAEKEPIKEMDLNPVFVNESGSIVADARIVFGEELRRETREVEDISFLFYPKAVAVIGASRKEGKPGNTILKNLINLGFRGKVFPVNPNADEILGMKVFPSILDVPADVDVAIIAVPSKYVVDIVRQCAEKGVKGLIIITSGFSEGWDKGKEIEDEVVKICRNAGIRIVGPNTTGIFNSENGFTSSFAFIPELRRGNVGIIAQTGLFVGILLEHILSAHGFGISKVVGLGNKCDVDECEALAFLLSDKDTKVIGMYLEGIKDGVTFLNILKKANKPIVVLKSGKTEAGAESAISHTASLAVSDEVFNALVKQTKIVRVGDFEEFIDTLKALSFLNPPKGKRVGVIHYTGAGCVTAADAVEENGLIISKFEGRTLNKLKKIFPEWHTVSNPVDLYPAIEEVGVDAAYNKALEVLLEDSNVDSIIVAMWASKHFSIPKIDFEPLKEFKKPVLFCLEGDIDVSRRVSVEIEREGFPVYSSATRAAKILSNMLKAKGKVK